MQFLEVVFKNLTRRPSRTALTLLAFATAIAAVVALLGVANGFTNSFSEIYESHSVDLIVSRDGSSDRLSSSVDERFAAEILQVDGVNKVAGFLFESLSLEEHDVFGAPAMGIAADSWLLDDYKMVSTASDENLKNAEGTNGRTLMLGVNLAERCNKKAGETVSLFEEPYLISHVFESSSSWENGALIVPLPQLQELTDRVDQVTYVNVVLDDSVDAQKADAVIAAIKQIDPKLHPLATDEFVATDTRMQLSNAMAWMTSMIAMIIGAIGVLNTMMTSVMERTREIGILRAIGWPKMRVVKMILLESCTLAVLASILGCIAAALLTWSLSQFSVTKGILSPSIDFSVMIKGFAMALCIGVIGAIGPAWRASKMLPTEAFRSQ